MQIYVDGAWRSREDAKISVFDHGLLYGDGVFEGIRVYSRRVFRLAAHVDRLYASAQALALTIPMARNEMTATVQEAVRRNRQEDGYIRLIITRGAGELGIDPLSCPRPTVIIIVTGIRVYPPALYRRGVKVVTSATRQWPPDVLDPRIKSLNYLKNVLAKIDAQHAGADEAIMLNGAGFIAECTADNLFVVRRGMLLTPALQDGTLEGVTRAVVLELGQAAGIHTHETHLTRYDTYTADECFLTGTGAEIMPVAEIDGRRIGDHTPGALTEQLSTDFHALVRREGDPLW